MKHRGQGCLGSLERTSQADQEPRHPRRDIQRSLLRPFQNPVIGIPFLADLPGHAVEALRALLGSRQRPVGNRPRDAAVAIVERVNGDKPQVRQCRPEYGIGTVRLVRPIKEPSHLLIQEWSGRRFVVNPFPAYGTGDNFHRSIRVAAPGTDDDPAHAATPCGEQRRMPGKEAVVGEGLVKVLGGIERHFHNTLNVPVCGNRPGNVHAQPPGDGRAHLIRVQVLAFDFTGLDDIQCQCLQLGFLPEREAEALHPTQQAPLPVTDIGQQGSQGIMIPCKFGPFSELVNIAGHSTHSMRRLCPLFSASSNVFFARNAKNELDILCNPGLHDSWRRLRPHSKKAIVQSS